MALPKSEEDTARKVDGTAIPKVGLILFALAAALFLLFALFRRPAPLSDPAAVQKAPLASPAAGDGGG